MVLLLLLPASLLLLLLLLLLLPASSMGNSRRQRGFLFPSVESAYSVQTLLAFTSCISRRGPLLLKA